MNFVAIDFETGDYSHESAVSVGLVKYRNRQAVDRFYSLLRPPNLYIRPDFTDIHGLTIEDVRNAPFFPDLWESRILPFIEGLPLAAHSAPFDMGVLRAIFAWYELPAPELTYFCTLSLSRRTWPELSSHALTALGKTFGISYHAHNALDDAHTCGHIACLAADKFGSNNITELLNSAGMSMKNL